MSPLDADLAAAYGQAADAWGRGPARIYDALAEELVARSPVPLAGSTVLDVGAGRGAASRAIAAVGGQAVPVDLAEGMLRASAEAGGRRGVVADARRLPVGRAAVDGVVAAFSYNHVADPVAALAEARRVTRPGGVVLASVYATQDDHPAKAAVDEAAAAAGWVPEPWISVLGSEAVPKLATVDRAAAAVAEAGLAPTSVDQVERAFPELGPAALVEWRMGMASVARFVAGLSAAARVRVAADALERLGADPPTLVRHMIVIAAVVPAG